MDNISSVSISLWRRQFNAGIGLGEFIKAFWGHCIAAMDDKTHGIAQLAKYVPGNIFHLAGRQALGMAAGIRGLTLAKSTAWELGLSAITGAFFAILVIPLMWSALPIVTSIEIFTALLLFSVFILNRIFSCLVAAAFIWQIIFLVLSGIIFVSVLALIAPSNITFLTLPLLCGAYVIAWLAGLVTPGAPAGVGVRELVLLFLLKGLVSEADLLVAVILGRMVTVSGDFLYFIIAFFIKKELVAVDSAPVIILGDN